MASSSISEILFFFYLYQRLSQQPRWSSPTVSKLGFWLQKNKGIHPLMADGQSGDTKWRMLEQTPSYLGVAGQGRRWSQKGGPSQSWGREGVKGVSWRWWSKWNKMGPLGPTTHHNRLVHPPCKAQLWRNCRALCQKGSAFRGVRSSYMLLCLHGW